MYPIHGGYDFASNGHGHVVSSQVSNGCGPSVKILYDFSHDGGIPWHELEHIDLEQLKQWP